MKFRPFPQYLLQKWTKTLHLEVVLYIILTSFMLILGKNFNIFISNIKRFYAAKKNKVGIIIRPPIVIMVDQVKVVTLQNKINRKISFDDEKVQYSLNGILCF